MSASLLSVPFRLCGLLVLLAFPPWLGRAATDTPVPDDQDPHIILASEVLELAYSPNSLRDSFEGFLTPALDAMKRDGMPDAARAEMRKAFLAWFDQNVKWDEIKPKLVQLYAKDFTTEELRALLTFLDKPVGQKVMAKLPLVMQDGALVGQQYFMSKQDSLNAMLAPIVEKYEGKGAAPPAAATEPGLRPGQ
jgi:hypothetical protein